MGCEIPPARVRQILESLEFGVEEEAEGYLVSVPSFRATKDVECDADLIEEVGRMYGYKRDSPASPGVAHRGGPDAESETA